MEIKTGRVKYQLPNNNETMSIFFQVKLTDNTIMIRELIEREKTIAYGYT
jgi:hypothetical protein